jgi:hypothetical protein
MQIEQKVPASDKREVEEQQKDLPSTCDVAPLAAFAAFVSRELLVPGAIATLLQWYICVMNFQREERIALMRGQCRTMLTMM